MRKSEFYEGWLRSLEIDEGLFVRLTGGPRPPCFFVAASRRSELDTPERVKLMSGLVPHLQQALRTHSRLADLAHRNADLGGALEVVRQGIIRSHRSRRRRACISAQDASRRPACIGTIAASRCARGRRLQYPRRPVLRLRTAVWQTALCRSRAAAASRWKDETSSEARALVLIIDPEHEPEPSAALMRRLHGLTNAEAEVALRISRGSSLREISDELSVSCTTVRTHLQHVFDKTDTHRPAELVRYLLANP